MPIVYSVATLGLVITLLTVALASPSPRTPPLAEIAPAAEDVLEVERVEQTAGSGPGGVGECQGSPADCDGAGPAAEPTTAPATLATSTPAAAVDFWPCVTGEGGPRQTEDPQSPPCIGERFVGDNGGATGLGVTATGIRVAVPQGADRGQPQLLAALVSHVNRRYELYGRRLELVDVASEADIDLKTPAGQRAFARQVAAAEVFASLSFRAFGVFQRELADQGIVTLVGGHGDDFVTEASLSALHPHAWSIHPTMDQTFDATVELVCGALVGRPAKHGGPDVADRTRHFGIIEAVPYDDPAMGELVDRLIARLQACPAPVERVEFREGETEADSMLARLRDLGVTTLVCVCHEFARVHTDGAEGLGWTPEWLLAGTPDDRVQLRPRSASAEQHPKQQLAHVFGVSSRLRPTSSDTTGGARYDEQFWFHAARQEDPGLAMAADSYSQDLYDVYAQLLILASGAQWAGPELTASSFGRALSTLHYPNPAVGQAPWYQPAAGFGPADHGFNSDFGLVWWRDPPDQEYQARVDHGRLCFVGGGTRFRPSTIPTDGDDRFFDANLGC